MFIIPFASAVSQEFPAATIGYVADALSGAGQNCCSLTNSTPPGTAANMEYLLKTVDMCNTRNGYPSNYGQSQYSNNLGANTAAVDAAAADLLEHAYIWVTYTKRDNPFFPMRIMKKVPLDGKSITCDNAYFTDPVSCRPKGCFVIWRDDGGALKYSPLANEGSLFTLPAACGYPVNLSGQVLPAQNSQDVFPDESLYSITLYIQVDANQATFVLPITRLDEFKCEASCNADNLVRFCYTSVRDSATGGTLIGKIAAEGQFFPATACTDGGFPCDVRVMDMNGDATPGIIRYSSKSDGIFIPD